MYFQQIIYIRNEKPKKSLRTEIAKSSFSIHKNSLHGNINSVRTKNKFLDPSIVD